MKETAHYKLKKPEISDYYDIKDFNTNADTIDTELKAAADHRAADNPHIGSEALLKSMATKEAVADGDGVVITDSANSHVTKRVTWGKVKAALKATLGDIGAVPSTRKVNGKELSEDIVIEAADIGARPDDWMPTAKDVGAATYDLGTHTGTSVTVDGLDADTKGMLTLYGETVEEPPNMIPESARQFEGPKWLMYRSAEVICTQGQTVTEWSTTTATRIQTTGGTDPLKFYFSEFVAPVAGDKYSYGVYVKNIGSVDLKVGVNGASVSDAIPPGQSRFVSGEWLGDKGPHARLGFLAPTSAENLDFVAWQPEAYHWVKSPDSPYTIKGVGEGGAVEVTTVGKNRYYPTTTFPQTLNGVTLNFNPATQEFTLNGTATSNATIQVASGVPFDNGFYGAKNSVSIYKISGTHSGGTATAFVESTSGVSPRWNIDAILSPGETKAQASQVFSRYMPIKKVSFGVYVKLNAVFNNFVFKVQSETGEPTDWVPARLYTVTAIPLSEPLHNLPSGVRDEADASGKVYRKTRKIIFSGMENWIFDPGYGQSGDIKRMTMVVHGMRPRNTADISDATNLHSDRLLPSTQQQIHGTIVRRYSNSLYVDISATALGMSPNNTAADLAIFKSWVAGASVVYELADYVTEDITPTSIPLYAPSVTVTTTDPTTPEFDLLVLNPRPVSDSLQLGGRPAADYATRDIAPLILTHAKAGTVHTFEPANGRPTSNGLYTGQFLATADYIEGDTITGWEAKPNGEDTALPDKAWVAEDVVQVAIYVADSTRKLGFGAQYAAHHVGSAAPTDTSRLWIDTANSHVIKYHNGTTWVACGAVWK